MAAPAPIKVFDPFRLDPLNQCLWRGDARILLAPKAFGVLKYLVDHAGRLVPQEELLRVLWPETFVQGEVLRKYILEIRKVLEDPPKAPRYIETLPKRGYQFIAPVTEEGSAASVPAPASRETVAASVAARFEAPRNALVGRNAPLADLNGNLDAMFSGLRQVVFITGEGGIGKTTLTDAFERQAVLHDGIRIARGQCMEGFGGKEAYYPVLEALGLLMRGPAGEALIRTLAAQAPGWLVQFPSVIKPEQRDALQREILGLTRERMVRELCEALEHFTAERPLILILEDLQWVDDSTLDLMSALARRRAPAKLMIVATYRPVEAILSSSPLRRLKQDLLIHRLCHEIALERLTEPEVEQFLLGQFPDSGLPRTLAGPVYRTSDGNPLFMIAVLERMREQGMIVARDGDWIVTAEASRLDPGVPETLQQMLELQLEQLSAEEQNLLRAASVAGSRFSVWAVSVMLELDRAEVEELCETLASQQRFLKRTEGAAAPQYEFRHALYREVLYRRLRATERRQLHLRLAERLEALSTPVDPALASELALHFEQGQGYDRAIHYLMMTARNHAKLFAHAESVGLLRHALELLPQLPAAAVVRERQIQILEHISDALYAQGEMAQSGEMDQRVAELAQEGGFKAAQVNALTRLARVLAFSDPDRCVAICERAVEASRTHNDPLLQARAEMLAGCWRIVTHGWSKKDSEACHAARQRIRSLVDEVPAYYEILFAHVQWIEGDYEGACQTARAGSSRAVETGSLVVYLSAKSSLVNALFHLGRGDELFDALNKALDVAQKNGNAPWLGIFRATLAWVRLHTGDAAVAQTLAENLMREHTEEPPGQARTMAMVTAGFAELASGNGDLALPYFDAICRRPSHPRFFLDWYWRMIARYGLASTCLQRGDLKRAASETDRLLEAVATAADPSLKAHAWEMQARLHLASGDLQQAGYCVEHARAALAAFAIPFASKRIEATAAELQKAAAQGAV
ncbi:MAG TPA: AAA family ATPase [Bryobacteraceae bacterium]